MLGGPPVRPLDRFQTRVVDDELQVGPRYSVTNSLEPVRARDPGEFTGGIWEYLYPPRPTTAAAALSRRCRSFPSPQRSASPPSPASATNGARVNGGGRRDGETPNRLVEQAKEVPIDVVGWVDERTGASTVPHRHAAAQGPEGDELVLHARLGDPVRLRDAGGHRRLPRDVLRALGDRGVRLDHPPDQRRLPRRVRPRPAQVGRDADDHPDLPPHGADVLLRRLQVPARAATG